LTPNINLSIPGGGDLDRQGMRLGLDLKGGTALVYQADLSSATEADRENRMNGALRIIENRVNAYGVAEPVVQLQGQDRIAIQLPGVKDINEAIWLVGRTANLDFREQVNNPDGAIIWQIAKATGSDGTQKELTGSYFKPNAAVTFDNLGKPQVSFEFDPEGAKLFEQITSRLIGKPLGIFLDGQVISSPTVEAVIRDQGVITGVPLAEARTLVVQLNAGALPVPLTLIQQQDVSATLGTDSLNKSLIAGIIGLALVFAFMTAYYRLPGFMAALALIVYAAITLALFKLIPVTLTLAGVAAFILSVGMAVDANVLIFERMKEELQWGKSLGAAMEAGFDRAWPSIRDSNVSTFITCIILYWFGSSFGATLIMGFALTLGLGVVVSMFTAVVVTRCFLRFVVRSGLSDHLALFRVPGQASSTSRGESR
ncbi:MAG: protein translocase subunit SecD, partial [Dehalococcoidia bacterium]|nr:protein translocase subunit SecD [Dehalococcoidia bacterium]